MAPDTYGKTWWRGIYACGCMVSSIEDIIEPRLKAAGFGTPVEIYQGAYNTSVGASAGTHSGGGALDHDKGNDAETIIWRECGVADWQRGSPEDTYFDDHNHGIWQGCPHVSNDADGQLDQYRAGCNGLSGWGPDQSPHVKPITWQDAYDKYIGESAGEGLWGMTESIYEKRTTDTPRGPADEFKDLMINDEDGYSVVSGETSQVTCSAVVQVGGLAAGEYFAVMWRVAKYKSGATTTYPYERLSERVYGDPDGGMVTVSSTYNGSLPDVGSGYSPRLRLAYKTDSPTAVVKAITSQGWST